MALTPQRVNPFVVVGTYALMSLPFTVAAPEVLGVKGKWVVFSALAKVYVNLLLLVGQVGGLEPSSKPVMVKILVVKI